MGAAPRDAAPPPIPGGGGGAASPPGPPRTGASAKDVVWTRNKTVLFRYRPVARRRHAAPVLLVYALINKPYVLDLRPGGSFVQHLLEHGHDVFLLDWGTPGWEDRHRSLDELVGEHLPEAVERTNRTSGGGPCTLFGYCMGGTMAVMHAALQPAGVRNLVALTTPVDFAHAGTLGVWTDPRHLDPWALAEALGNIPADLVHLATTMLRPVTNLVTTPAAMARRRSAGEDMTAWLSLDRWVNDGVPFPGTAFAQWIETFYQRNALVRGEARIAGDAVRLERMTAALLNVAGAQDHLVPPAMARPLNALANSEDGEYHELAAGHVGLLAGSGARTGLWPLITDWLATRSD